MDENNPNLSNYCRIVFKLSFSLMADLGHGADILDGNSEIGAHVWTYLGFLSVSCICLDRGKNRKYLSPVVRAQHDPELPSDRSTMISVICYNYP